MRILESVGETDCLLLQYLQDEVTKAIVLQQTCDVNNTVASGLDLSWCLGMIANKCPATYLDTPKSEPEYA